MDRNAINITSHLPLNKIFFFLITATNTKYLAQMVHEDTKKRSAVSNLLCAEALQQT